MIRTEDELRREIVEIGRWIHGQGLVSGYDGNISARLDAHRILSTPTAISKGMMQPDGLVTYGPDLLRAYFRMETVEHFAKISLVTEILGRQVLLSGSEVDKLLAVRQRYFGSGTPAVERTNICPVTDAPEAAAVSKPAV